MGMSTYCCLNRLPPTTTLNPTSSPPLPTTSNLVPRKVDEERSKLISKNAVAIVCAIVIGLEVGSVSSNTMASELTMQSHLITTKTSNTRRVARWSDKRICPPWHMNSLETIVPENLPRPSAPRKWEGVTYSDSQLAPSVKHSVSSRASCFTM